MSVSAPTAAAASAPPVPQMPRLRSMVEEAFDLNKEGRERSLKDEWYFHSQQYTPDELRVLQKRKQPHGVFNRIKPAVLSTLGVLAQGVTDPRAYPRNPADEDAADVASKVLLFISDKNRFQSLKVAGAREYLVLGTMAAITEVDDDRQVIVTPIRFEEFFADPRSRRLDFKDARYMGVAKWRYADEVAADYPDQKDKVEACLESGLGFIDDTTEDRPRNAATTVEWVDGRKRRLMQVELYYQEGGKWLRCCFCAAGVLDHGPSPYLDEKKRPANPIEAQSCFIDPENQRYGVVRDQRPVQDEINRRRNKSIHILNTAQVQGTQASSMATDADTVRKEAARPDGVIPFGYEKVPMGDALAGHVQMLEMATQEIERFSPNPAMLGRQGADSSGRAQMIRQQAGMTELAVVFSGVEEWELRVFRQMWSRVQQFWTGPQFIRVTDDVGAPQFVGINQPPEGGQMVGGPDGQPLLADPQTQQPSPTGQPVFQMPDGSYVLGYQNGVAQMDVDIMVDTTPDVANVQQEQFQQLVQLVGSNPTYATQVPFSIMLKMSAVPQKRQLLEQMQQTAEQAEAAQQAAQGLAQEGAKAKIAETASKAELNSANAAKAHADAHKSITSAAVDSLKASSQAAHDRRLVEAEVLKANASAGLQQAQTYSHYLTGVQGTADAASAAQGMPVAGA